ncbi:chemotaxis protein CheC [Paludisphaera sp.]|uniref:chemotaxis protein CheC n=1 Tax=Paludisphaera sp. TaxID=2017432 RepID=UPI00301CF160
MNTLGEDRGRMLRTILAMGSEGASRALSRWLGMDVRLTLGEVELVDLATAAGALGPPESLVAACAMGLTGGLGGAMLLCFEDRDGLALADLLLRRPVGTATEWGEVERSAAMETANIVACAYLNALAAHLPTGEGAGLAPTPPTFLHEFAGCLIEFAVMGQAAELDRVLLAGTTFEVVGSGDLGWTLLFVPDAPALASLSAALGGPA